MRWARNNPVGFTLATTAFLGIALACSGVAGPSVGAHTKRMADHLSQDGVCHKNDDPCPKVNVYSGNQAGRIGDWEWQLGEPFLTKGEVSLPYIKNSTERSKFRKDGIMALVVPIRFKNLSPVAAKERIGLSMKDTLGESRGIWPYNSHQWAKELKVEDAWDYGKAPPDKWIDTVYVFAVDEAGVDGAALYFTEIEKRRYVTGKSYKAMKDHMLIELPPVTRREGPLPWRKDKE